MKIFGSTTYIHSKTDKLEPRARKCIFLGYGDGIKGYRLWCTETPGGLLISRHVKFDELSVLNKNVQETTNDDQVDLRVHEMEPTFTAQEES